MKNKLLIVSACLGFAASANAATISVNFTEGIANQQMAAGTSAGLAGFQATNWNNTNGGMGTLSALNDDSGSVTTASVSWDAQGGGTWGDGSANADANAGVGDAQLRRGYIDDNGGDASSSITFSVAGITYNTFTVIVYYASGDSANTQFQATNLGGNVMLPTAAAGANNAYSTNPNWDATNTVQYTGLTGTTFSGFTLDRNTTGTGRASLAGIQVVDTTVPEPSSTALLGLGGLALILRRRK